MIAGYGYDLTLRCCKCVRPVVIIRLTGSTMRFGQRVVHRDVALSVLRGEVLCIVGGGSGSGKTTLSREMLGLDTPTAGKVEVLGARRGARSSQVSKRA